MGCDSIFIVSVCLCVSLFNSLHDPYMASHDVLDGSIPVDEEPCAIPGMDIHSGAWWWPASPECVCATIFEMQTTVPVLSMSLVGLPSPSWDASVKKVTSVSWVARGRPCRTAGDAHQATSCRTHWGTVILSDQFPVLWHHAVVAHHWTGQNRNLPRRTSSAINTTMPSNLCRSRAVMTGFVIQCWWTDWILRRIFSRGANVNCRVLNCIPRNWKSWLGVRSNFSKLMTHPSCWNRVMVISACSWACFGDSAWISQK